MHAFKIGDRVQCICGCEQDGQITELTWSMCGTNPCYRIGRREYPEHSLKLDQRILKMQNDTRYDDPNFTEIVWVDPHDCAPYVGVTHIDEKCVHCGRWMNSHEIKAYLQRKVSL